MTTFTVLLLVAVLGGMFWAAYNMTLTREEIEAELDEHVRRRLTEGRPDGDRDRDREDDGR